MKRHLILIGFSTSGKSTVGQLLAARLGWSFIDTDERIVQMAGKPIPAIFENDGEASFRRMERDALKEACAGERAVIATGGGAVLLEENRELMHSSGWIVCLEATPETIYQRLLQHCQEGGTGVVRPLLAGPDPRQRIQTLKKARAPFYQIADLTIPTDDLTPQEVAAQILSFVLTADVTFSFDDPLPLPAAQFK